MMFSCDVEYCYKVMYCSEYTVGGFYSEWLFVQDRTGTGQVQVLVFQDFF